MYQRSPVECNGLLYLFCFRNQNIYSLSSIFTYWKEHNVFFFVVFYNMQKIFSVLLYLKLFYILNVWYPYYYSIFINLVLLKSKSNNFYSSIIFFQSVVQKISQFIFHCEYFCDIQICKQNVHREKESLFVIITF